MNAIETSETIQRALDELPLDTRFELGLEITPLQNAFLERHGYLIFNQVAKSSEVDEINSEVDRIMAEWIQEQKKTVNGVPIFRGYGLNGKELYQRLPFTSLFSNSLHAFVRDKRFDPVRHLIGENTRIGDREKDGLVVNTFINVPGSVYPRLGWHTDGLRDIFYLKMPKRMLNVGIHLSDCPAENGGLRLIPGTHKQGFFKMCFYKPYFIWHRADKREIALETRAGDLTIHDGRLWHRVAQSPHTGKRSFRRSMYVPYLTDGVLIKNQNSKTPFYHHLGRMIRAIKTWRRPT